MYDAQRNGPFVAFTRQLNPKIMDRTSNYSEETMKKVAARYQKEAETINAYTPTTSLIRQWCTCCPNPSLTRAACRD